MAIFGKNDSAPAGDRPAAPPPGAPASGQTVLGPKAYFVGELKGDEDVVIQGRLEGNVDIPRKVTVAAAGEVHGDVHGRSVVVGGKVRGQIRADERAELLASALVEGNVQAPKVVIAEGAQLQGNVAMAASSPAAK